MFETNRHNKKGMKTRPSAVFLRRCKWADNGAPRPPHQSLGWHFVFTTSKHLLTWSIPYLGEKKRKKRVNNWIVTSSGPVLSVWSSSSGPLMRACVSSALSSLSNVITVSKQTNRRRTKKRTHRERDAMNMVIRMKKFSHFFFSRREKISAGALIYTVYRCH